MKTNNSSVTRRAGHSKTLLLAVGIGAALVARQGCLAASAENAAPNPSPVDAVRAAAQSGTVAFRLTTPEELIAVLGQPQKTREVRDGDMIGKVLEFPRVNASFGKFREFAGPYTLVDLQIDGRPVDLGRDRTLVLRTADDFGKLDSLRGLAGVSLIKLDLRDQLKQVSRFTFDSRTIWPPPDRMPPGFDPERVLEEGKDPGLGVRKLHAAGIVGAGVGIAIIDQPLLKDHQEYKGRLVSYTEVDTDGSPPQMHGPAVASIAVGKECGVAPGASLYYFAVPSWKWLKNEPWAEQLERVIALNATLKDTPRIRVVSISLGAFSERPNPERWSAAVKRAEENNILVLTCDPQFLRLATLKRIEGRANPGPTDYVRGWFGYPADALSVPAANRTFASVHGPTSYTLDRTGGLSWTVPYLAGVAALAWQADPALKPSDLLDLLKRTAVKTPEGNVVSPTAVIEEVRRRTKQG
jgi:hypothetical protein